MRSRSSAASRRLPAPAVDHEAIDVLTDLRIKVVQQAAEGAFLLPAATAKDEAAGSRARARMHPGDCSVRRVSGTPLLGGLAAAGGLSLAVWLAALLDLAGPGGWSPSPRTIDRRCRALAVRLDRGAGSGRGLTLPSHPPALLAQDYPGDWRVVPRRRSLA